MNEKTIGEIRVRTEFNPSQSGTVDQIKQKTAELINLVAQLPPPSGEGLEGEQGRLKALAMTDLENAAMWAVKAATC